MLIGLTGRSTMEKKHANPPIQMTLVPEGRKHSCFLTGFGLALYGQLCSHVRFVIILRNIKRNLRLSDSVASCLQR